MEKIRQVFMRVFGLGEFYLCINKMWGLGTSLLLGIGDIPPPPPQKIMFYSRHLCTTLEVTHHQYSGHVSMEVGHVTCYYYRWENGHRLKVIKPQEFLGSGFIVILQFVLSIS